MKKLLAILLALVLCISCFALIACNNCEHEFKDGVCTKCGEKDPDYKGPQGGGDADVPVAEGKVTFFLTLGEGSVEIPEYGSIFYAGGLTSWNEAGAPALTRLNDTNVYYVQLAYDATMDKANEYKVSLGYNKQSGLPDSKLGIQWSLTSDECPDGLENCKFTYTEGATKINLGTHTFTTALSAPVTLDALQLRVTFSAALGANAEVYIMGDFNGWNADNAKATANADRTVYSLDLTEVLCTNYTYKILVYKDGAKADTLELKKAKVDKDGNPVLDETTQEPVMEDLGIWDRYVKEPNWEGHAATDILLGYTVISAGTNNLPLEVTEFDGEEGYIDLAGTVSEAFADQPVVGIDLSKAILLEGQDTNDAGEKVGNGKFTWTYSSLGKKVFKVTFTEALDENVIVFIPGGMNGWDESGASDKMTIAADRKSATWTMEVAPGTYEYKLVFFHKDVFNGNVWSGKGAEFGVPNDNGMGNASVKVEGFDDGDVILFADAITAPAVTQPSTEPVVTLDKVTFKVTFSGDMTGKHVYLVGTPTGWTFTEMTAGANGVYTIEVSNVDAKEHEYKVVVGDTVLAGWDDPRTGEYGGTDGTGSANAAVTVAANATTVELFGGASLTAPTAA